MRTLSYIICSKDWGDPLVLSKRSNSVWKKVPADGVLFRDHRDATIFVGKPEARAAMKRTVAYFKKTKGDTQQPPFGGFELRRLV